MLVWYVTEIWKCRCQVGEQNVELGKENHIQEHVSVSLWTWYLKLKLPDCLTSSYEFDPLREVWVEAMRLLKLKERKV